MRNRYDNDISKPFRLLSILGWRFILGIIALAIFIGYINPLIKSQLANVDTNSILAPITHFFIQYGTDTVFFLEASIFLWWIYIIGISIYYYLKPESIYALDNREIRSMGALTPVWTDLLPMLLSVLFTYFTH